VRGDTERGEEASGVAIAIQSSREAAGHATVFLEDGALVMRGFRETDPEVLALARDAADVESTLHRCLEVGARALRLAETTLDAEVVERAFADMAGRLDRTVSDFNRSFEGTASGLLDAERGELPRALAHWKGEVEQLLGATFDPDSKRSVLAKLDAVLLEAQERQLQALRRLINPDHDESPLARWRAEIVRAVGEQGLELRRAFADLSEKLGIREAEEAALEKAAQKGFRFEDLLLRRLEAICAAAGEVPQAVGGQAGAQPGSKVGDVVVTLSLEATRGRAARYVVECKDRRLPLAEALAEIDRGMRNREALAGIMVFSSAANAPIAGDFQDFGDKAIVVLDKDEGDARALRLACLWARWVVGRELAGTAEELDRERVLLLVDRARRALNAASTVRRSHTAARNQIDEAVKHFDGLVCAVDEALAELVGELAP
jgi:hypothetical protein